MPQVVHDRTSLHLTSRYFASPSLHFLRFCICNDSFVSRIVAVIVPVVIAVASCTFYVILLRSCRFFLLCFGYYCASNSLVSVAVVYLPYYRM